MIEHDFTAIILDTLLNHVNLVNLQNVIPYYTKPPIYWKSTLFTIKYSSIPEQQKEAGRKFLKIFLQTSTQSF